MATIIPIQIDFDYRLINEGIMMMTKYFIFKKLPTTIDFINSFDISSEAQIATEIIAAHEGLEVDSLDYWAYEASDLELKPMMAWHELSKTRFYSVVLNQSLCDLWAAEVMPHMRGDNGVISSELWGEISSYLDGATEIIHEQGDHSMLNFIGLDLSSRLKSAFDDYLEDCCEDIFDVFDNAFQLKEFN